MIPDLVDTESGEHIRLVKRYIILITDNNNVGTLQVPSVMVKQD